MRGHQPAEIHRRGGCACAGAGSGVSLICSYVAGNEEVRCVILEVLGPQNDDAKVSAVLAAGGNAEQR